MTEPYFPVDGKTPDWIKTPLDEVRYVNVLNRAHRLGFTGTGAGWAMIPSPHGAMTVRGLPTKDEGITVTSTTPMMAVEAMDWLLSRLEEADR